MQSSDSVPRLGFGDVRFAALAVEPEEPGDYPLVPEHLFKQNKRSPV